MRIGLQGNGLFFRIKPGPRVPENIQLYSQDQERINQVDGQQDGDFFRVRQEPQLIPVLILTEIMTISWSRASHHPAQAERESKFHLCFIKESSCLIQG